MTVFFELSESSISCQLYIKYVLKGVLHVKQVVSYLPEIDSRFNACTHMLLGTVLVSWHLDVWIG